MMLNMEKVCKNDYDLSYDHELQCIAHSPLALPQVFTVEMKTLYRVLAKCINWK